MAQKKIFGIKKVLFYKKFLPIIIIIGILGASVYIATQLSSRQGVSLNAPESKPAAAGKCSSGKCAKNCADSEKGTGEKCITESGVKGNCCVSTAKENTAKCDSSVQTSKYCKNQPVGKIIGCSNTSGTGFKCVKGSGTSCSTIKINCSDRNRVTPTVTATTTIAPTASPTTNQICTPFKAMCNVGNVITCNSAGTNWELTSCNNYGCHTEGGSAVCNVCVPNAYFCKGISLSVCNSSGTGSRFIEYCANGGCNSSGTGCI